MASTTAALIDDVLVPSATIAVGKAVTVIVAAAPAVKSTSAVSVIEPIAPVTVAWPAVVELVSS
ncbi:hypothetical protein, partial [Pseudomonas viridiflava]|uniref:hypothetical protein n=1 Tax=Pseudomonas viridiflava TaxID=33069 RepID=UPI001F11F7CA